MHRTAAGRRAVKIRPAEFRAEMTKRGATSNMEIARLLKCGESTVSRLIKQRQNLSGDVLVALAVELGPRGLVRVCDFGDDMGEAA